MKLSDFDFNLPKNLIAQKPASPRDVCRLMVLNREKQLVSHERFYNLGKYLRRGDVLVFVEVKTRGGTGYGYPEEAITETKRQRMERVAELYCLASRFSGMRRLDTIAVILRGAAESDIKHFENV